ncbi:CMP-N-acetylneuraminate-poly-alpha-2,8-sialyltransferase-like [Ptychodera flava]|uniref:CMP-N-acetylneuraminate-poly-alpha-2, 8-sialyltransferase-like n=1 Tax=Ptychodera flava TaxID=63121 RepID=UPI00396A7C52
MLHIAYRRRKRCVCLCLIVLPLAVMSFTVVTTMRFDIFEPFKAKDKFTIPTGSSAHLLLNDEKESQYIYGERESQYANELGENPFRDKARAFSLGMRPLMAKMLEANKRKQTQPRKTNNSPLQAFRKNISENIFIKQDIRIFKLEVQPSEINFLQSYQDKLVRHDLSYQKMSNLTTPLKNMTSCAVVASDSVLKNSKCGFHIDSTPFVMRTTLLTQRKDTYGDIGRKSDLTFLDRSFLSKLHNSLSERNARTGFVDPNDLREYNKTIFLYPWRIRKADKERLQLRHTTMRLRQAYGIHLRMAYSPLKPLALEVNEFWGLSQSNAGLILTTMAILFCDKVEVYGAGSLIGNNRDGIQQKGGAGYGTDAVGQVARILNKMHDSGIIKIRNKCA